MIAPFPAIYRSAIVKHQPGSAHWNAPGLAKFFGCRILAVSEVAAVPGILQSKDLDFCMDEQPTHRRVARSVVAALIFACISTIAESQTDPAILTAVDVNEATSASYRIVLSIQGKADSVETTRLEGGRFVFDLAPVAWNGPTRRVRPDLPGIHGYRFSQFSRDPLVTRFVVEVGTGWTCRHERAPSGFQVVCSGPPIVEAPKPSSAGSVIAVVCGLELSSPLAGLDAEKLVDRSLGFTPQDIVRDGLPNFGSIRDDWIGEPRPHKGLDIYGDKIGVQAVAKGKVVGIGYGERSGGWTTIRHGNGVETLYVHISGLKVETGDEVARGQSIAAIDGAVGNAVQAQLHFELRLDEESVDPVPYIFEFASEDLKRKITLAKERLAVLEQERASRVRNMVEGRHK